MDLKKSDNPRRIYQWNGKSLARCSREDLIHCVLHLNQQINLANVRIQQMDTLIQLRLRNALEYEIMPATEKDGQVLGPVTLKRREQPDGSKLWAVYLRDTLVLDVNGDWILEPLPSSRSEKFLQDTCFELEDAWLRAVKAAELIVPKVEIAEADLAQVDTLHTKWKEAHGQA